MTEQELVQAIGGRTGADEAEVRAVVREFWAQAFVMAMEKGGTLVVPRFGTFRARPDGRGGMDFRFRPRTPEELIRSLERRRAKLDARRAPASRNRESAAALVGQPYVPRPMDPPQARPRRGARPERRGFFARLFGGGS